MKKNEQIRLNVFIQEHGLASRRKADEMIEAGLIKVNGKIVKTLGTKIEKTDEVHVNGKKIGRKPNKAIYLFHKPYLTLTSRSDDRNRPTIFDIPQLKRLSGNVQAVGRLDFKSEGLLVLTNDGDLALALSHPKYSVEKTYSVLLSTQLTPEELEKLKKGIQLEDGFAKPLYVKPSNREKFANSTGQWVEIAVTEGRNRLVRRLMEAIGLKVVRLMRIAIGNLRLPASLQPGKLRPVTEQEKIYLTDLKKVLEPEVKLKKRSVKADLEQPLVVDNTLAGNKKPKAKNYIQEVKKRQVKAQTISKERRKKETL